MRRTTVGFVVLSVLALVVALGWTGRATAEPLSLDSLQKPAATAADQIPEEINTAMGKLYKGDVDGALADMKAAAAKYPHLPPAEVIMGQIFARAGQIGQARMWLERAIVETPNDPESYVMLGQLALQNKQFAEARLLFEKAQQTLAGFNSNPKRKESLQATTSRQLAALAMARKDLDTATGHLNELLKLRANDADGLQLLARLLYDQEKPLEALDKLKLAKKSNKDLLTPEAILAQWYEESKDHANATKYMTIALETAPRDFMTRLEAAKWAFGAELFKQSAEQAGFALQLAQQQELDPSQALVLAGNVAIFQGDYPAAEKHLRAAVALSPATFTATNNLALALCEQDNKEKQQLALQYARINANLYPKQLEAGSTLGRVLFRLGNYQEANAIFEKVRGAGQPLSMDTVYYLADLYAATERKDEAKKLLKEVVKQEGLFSQRKNAEQLLKTLGP
ncbi:MAG TPA: tetratricopeptide repeat protein [Thermoguttaceae bacterium]|nr:tetratricopeptide repeat protein [Thermoguttaceae bacterium]